MSIQDILRLSRTCQMMRNVVEGYWRTAFNFPTLMQPFISNESLYCFRQMLKATGRIISGSMALQYLDRACYENSDLDIFVNHSKCDIMSKWLLSKGMKRVKDSPQRTAHSSDNVNPYDGSGETHHVEEYEVFYSDKPRTIQLVAMRGDPVLAVLKFHSCTPVMTLTRLLNFLQRPQHV